jgi:hypothetical protein
MMVNQSFTTSIVKAWPIASGSEVLDGLEFFLFEVYIPERLRRICTREKPVYTGVVLPNSGKVVSGQTSITN